MSFRSIRAAVFLWLAVGFPLTCPAPFIFRPGEGIIYERPGEETNWRRMRAAEQLQVAQAAFDKQDYSLALKAARNVVARWGQSDYAPQAQFLVARSREAKGDDSRAFKEYQVLLEKYPKSASFEEALNRQFEIANKYLAGKWFKLWGVVPFFSSMDKTAAMYAKIVKTGPYSEVAPRAQLKVGAAREKQKQYPEAVKAYEQAADRYHDRPAIAAEALFSAGRAYQKQALTGEYDQTTAAQAIAMLTDFKTLYPDDQRVADADRNITLLRTEQARGSFKTAQFYEHYRKWQGALVYYNEVLLQDPDSQIATVAKQRIDTLKTRAQRVTQ
jgi:outer membrane protein assembly factor BamD